MNERNAELQAITDTFNLDPDGLHLGNIETFEKTFTQMDEKWVIVSKAYNTSSKS